MTLKLVRDELTLVYGLHLFSGVAAESGAHTHVAVSGPEGRSAQMALHTIRGTRGEIRAQLLQSIDAFFDLVDPS
jgi:hypothetical protein